MPDFDARKRSCRIPIASAEELQFRLAESRISLRFQLVVTACIKIVPVTVEGSLHDRGPATDAFTKEQVEALIREARNGSQIAFGKLVRASQDYLRAVARRSLPGSLQAKLSPSDLVQDTALEAHRDISSFQGAQFAELLAWMRQILVHNLSNYKRHFEQTAKRSISREICGDQAAHAIENLDNSTPSPSSRLAYLEQRHAMQDVLSRLPEEMKAVIELRNKEGLSFTEIGVRIDCSSPAARRMWARAIERMQRLLPNDEGHV